MRRPVPRRALRWLLLALAVATLVACDPPSDGEADARRPIAVALLERPARVGPATVEVRPALDGAPVSGARVRVVGDMTHAGMVPVVAEAPEVGAGVYRTEGFAFDMAGDWVLSVDVTYPDGTERAAALAVFVGGR
ncbi:MAG: FixH family protein [Trueperaceae bacterium]|nr:FixH family protein [Trueperaceae bacterium]